ncbi:hypothetical protein DPMN_045259 [Dreissena polymorpha]|uniref:Uncharacterized protein n=1 Tax=Dreissena polymorpha TaxID=45954 RepID=A0A9D4D5W9_DREPO|nr:hypothetical protein DPMN_045259 [Dreissena polymorpha]
MCSRSVTDANGQPRYNYGGPQTIYVSYMDHPGCCHHPGLSKINKAVLKQGSTQIYRVCITELQGNRRTFKDRHGASRRLHVSYAD